MLSLNYAIVDPYPRPIIVNGLDQQALVIS